MEKRSHTNERLATRANDFFTGSDDIVDMSLCKKLDETGFMDRL
jgi:hypothetical protein